MKPLKKLGQNFLIDKTIINKIVKNACLTKQDIVLEIGPGLGALTKELVKHSKKVIAIEKDKRLIPFLKKLNNAEIMENDVLKYEIPDFKYKIVANLPYNIGLKIIRKFIEANNPPLEMIVMVQKEVAQKICSSKSSLPKIAVSFFAEAEILFFVPKTCFYPQPKVDGAVMKIKNIQKNTPDVNQELFFKILRKGFSFPRKTILNNLKQFKTDTLKWLKKAGISPLKRPEDLKLEDWVKLCNGFEK